jgi:2-C-methyl-D-erythritol 4-phosphate cytidylyltransferase
MHDHHTANLTTAPPCTVIVVAAGQGQRFGGDVPKQYQMLLDRPLLAHTLERLHRHPVVERIVPVIAPDGTTGWQCLAPWLSKLPKVAPPVTGGRERQESVWNALTSLRLETMAWVAVHDGARPILSGTLLNRLFEARAHTDACIAALPASDTIKEVDASGRILRTRDRRHVWLAQTPQVFRFGLLHAAHQQARTTGFLGTDDASLVERLGHPVTVVMGDSHNIKVTRPEDWPWATFLLQENADGDIHAGGTGL